MKERQILFSAPMVRVKHCYEVWGHHDYLGRPTYGHWVSVGVVVEGATTPWSWASLPGLRGRRLSTRFSIDDHWEEFSLHDGPDGGIVVREWVRTMRFTAAFCRDPGMVARARAWLTSERRPERKP